MPNLTFGAPVVQCLRKNIPNAFFGKQLYSIVQLASTPPLPFFRFTHDGLSPRAGIYNGSGKRQVILIFL